MIDKIEAFDQAHIAVHIESINSRRTKIEYAGDDFMTPASNTKLLTFLRRDREVSLLYVFSPRPDLIRATVER